MSSWCPSCFKEIVFFRSGVLILLAVFGGCLGGNSEGPSGLTMTSMNPSDHTGFPIDAASRHATTTCNDCHGLSDTFTQFSCVDCHDHEEVKTRLSHVAIPAFVYSSRACYNCHPSGNRAQGSAGCNSCHGGVNDAPPNDTLGNSATTFRGVGAHQLHLTGGRISNGFACAECHVVPDTVDASGHIDSALPAEVGFGDLAMTGNVVPSWDQAALTCANTYCHGNFPGGTTTTPVWTRVDGTQTACNSCHGMPPAFPHPQDANCATCHPTVVDAGNNIINKALHVNGKIDVIPQYACNGCHGDAASDAPPKDMAGNTATTFRGVGAHRVHLNGGAMSAGFACNECHLVPAAMDSPGHRDTALPAEVVFGALSKTGGLTPAWNGSTCANTYCHGKFSGGTTTLPLWTKVDGTQAACGTCHGMPPAFPHPQRPDCSGCHSAVVDAGNNFVDKALHVNGFVEVDDTMTCNSCHGGAANDAPPVDLSRDPAHNTSTREIGAHQIHLTGGNLSVGIACNECHKVPTGINSPGHRDTVSPAEVIFGTLSKMGGAVPAWVTGNLTCTNTYCHGKFTGGLATAPVWTTVNGSQTRCGTTCHALPPSANHQPTDTDCALCHGSVINAGNTTFKNKALHINGVVEVTGGTACNSCHGGANNAPPKDTSGNTAITARGVGVHQKHVVGGTYSNGVACNECHIVPAVDNSPGHRDTSLPAEVTFGALSRTGGVSPSWVAGNLTCTGTYCHGNFTGGNTAAAPSWVTAGLACASCHGISPATRKHPSVYNNHRNVACAECHGTGYTNTAVRKADHIDGAVDVGGTGSKITTWNSSTKRCSTTCHSAAGW
jgi:predicted CxxxxCH...CXXCH cytochrome family protein